MQNGIVVIEMTKTSAVSFYESKRKKIIGRSMNSEKIYLKKKTGL